MESIRLSSVDVLECVKQFNFPFEHCVQGCCQKTVISMEPSMSYSKSYDSFAGQSVPDYSSMSNISASFTDHRNDKIEMKSKRIDNNIHNHSLEDGNFYSSGDLGLTLRQNERSWIDPWELSPADTYYHKNTSSPLQSALKKSILTQSTFNSNHRNVKNEENNRKQSLPSTASKFGPWDGVMAGCLLNIFGVIMFLRVGWIVGQCGVLYALLIILISTTITMLTTLSMSAI